VATPAADVARSAITALEPTGDHAGLARAWRLLMGTAVNAGHLDQASEAAEHVVAEAAQADDRRIASRSTTTIAYVLLHGPTPVPEAIRECQALHESVAGNRATQGLIESTLSVLTAMSGDFDEARRLYGHSQAVLTEMSGGIDALSGSFDSSRVELLAGNIDAAFAELTRDYDALEQINESFFRSSVAARLATVTAQRGDLEAASHFADVAQELGEEDDLDTQVGWRIARARIAAARGDAETAKALAADAVGLASATTDGLLRTDALSGQADVLEAIGDRESAGPPLREALELYEAKGDVVSARALRARLATVAVG
jgi:ATP/maltotriose-dependent transcriptional regulator MalT